MPGLVIFGRVAGVCSGLQGLSLDPNQVQLEPAAHGRVFETLDGGQVRVVQSRVLAHQGNVDRIDHSLLGQGERLPFYPKFLALLNVGRRNVDLVEQQSWGEEVDQILVIQKDGNVVGGANIVDGDDLLVVDVAKQGNLLDGSRVEDLFATARNLTFRRTRGKKS